MMTRRQGEEARARREQYISEPDCPDPIIDTERHNHACRRKISERAVDDKPSDRDLTQKSTDTNSDRQKKIAGKRGRTHRDGSGAQLVPTQQRGADTGPEMRT